MRNLSFNVCWAVSVKVEDVVSEERPRKGMVGTAVGLTLEKDRSRNYWQSRNIRRKQCFWVSYSDGGAEVIRAVVESSHVQRPLVFPLHKHTQTHKHTNTLFTWTSKSLRGSFLLIDDGFTQNKQMCSRNICKINVYVIFVSLRYFLWCVLFGASTRLSLCGRCPCPEWVWAAVINVSWSRCEGHAATRPLFSIASPPLPALLTVMVTSQLTGTSVTTQHTPAVFTKDLEPPRVSEWTSSSSIVSGSSSSSSSDLCVRPVSRPVSRVRNLVNTSTRSLGRFHTLSCCVLTWTHEDMLHTCYQEASGEDPEHVQRHWLGNHMITKGPFYHCTR